MNSRRAWLVWALLVIAYIVAVLQRSSLGVAGVAAAERFDVSASGLSTLAVVQLAVYAALQVPVGVLLDRLGSRAMITAGAVLMAIGQLTLAFAPGIEFAVLGRVLLGAGDAFTFISVIRLLPAWFSGRILPQISQWTGNLGQIGQILSAIPLSFLLRETGWETTFALAAALSLVIAIAIVTLVTDAPPGSSRSHTAPTWRHAMGYLGASLKRPGTRLGFWSHFVTQSSGTMIALLWGYPMLTEGLGYPSSTASGLLTLMVVVGAFAGPVLGILTARFPMRRSNLVLGIVVALGMAWSLVLLWPGIPPMWAVVVLFVTLGAGGPGSLIGFDFARTFNPLQSQGSANGIVNVGGFLASFVLMFLIGVVLDVLDRERILAGLPSDIFSWESFRIAFTLQYVVIGAGVIGLLVSRRRTRALMGAEDGIRVAPL